MKLLERFVGGAIAKLAKAECQRVIPPNEWSAGRQGCQPDFAKP